MQLILRRREGCLVGLVCDWLIMDHGQLKITGQKLGLVFHSRLGRACIGHAIVHITKQPDLKLKTQPKQLLGSLLLA